MSRTAVHRELLLEPGRRLRLGDGTELTCGSVQQRNWSRVAIGTTDSAHRLFLKQHVDMGGAWQQKLWMFEQEGHAAAERVLPPLARVPRLIDARQDALVNVYEYVPMQPMDALLRVERGRFTEQFPRVVERMRDVLAAMASVSVDELDLHENAASSTSDKSALNFKGFDIRNVALTPNDEISLFDFGRPYVASIMDAGAKLFVSIGMLNWGHPPARFARGVDTAMLRTVVGKLEPFIDRSAVLDELERQRFRFTKIHASNGIERLFKKAGLFVLGERYMRQLEGWCLAHLP